jgi:predicted Zn-dependent protease
VTEERERFESLARRIFSALRGAEVLLLNLEGEDSDFVRFNRGRVRHAGHVRQRELRLDLVSGARRVRGHLQLGNDLEADADRSIGLLSRLREQLPHVPDDPYLLYATTPHDTEHIGANRLLPGSDALDQVLEMATGLDLVGTWSGGLSLFGFANSLGQRNWHSEHGFCLDWSVYDERGQGVKDVYADDEFSKEHVAGQLAYARESLAVLRNPTKTIEPGRYRVFLAPEALYELMDVVGRGGFGLKSHETAQTPLLRLVREEVSLHPEVELAEDNAGGRGPIFTKSGFIKPPRVDLVTGGRYRDCLANARSAKEYGGAVNSTIEHPQALSMSPGTLHQDHVLEALGTGLFVANLWYCNFSDRNSCRITGLTRFACLWVENGRAVGPVEVMRFDESLYHALGSGLEAITEEREYMVDTSTYGRRSTATAVLPGVLVDGFAFTL